MQRQLSSDSRAFSIVEMLVILIIIALIGIVGWFIYHKDHKASTLPSSTSRLLAPPNIPSVGAYLGAYVDPGSSTGQKGTLPETTNLPNLNKTTGEPLSIVHIYTAWATPAPTTEASTLVADKATPLIDWGGTSYSSITSGSEDSVIKNYAISLKNFKQPVFLRWNWEMNLVGHNKEGTAADFILAWRHIYTIFQQEAATNVSFVWCPGLGGGLSGFTSWYPGDQYVNWIAIDGYDRKAQGTAAFSDLFSSWYGSWSTHGKPLMIAETGAQSVDQAAYLQGLQASLPKYPDIKAVVYFDAVGPAGNWTLAGSGLTQFTQLAQSSYFQPKF